MRVLVVAPHMDDEVLGTGGFIARHVEQGDEVHVCFVAHRIYDHKFDDGHNRVERVCSLKAKDILGYKEATFLNLPDERLDTCIQEIIIPLEQKVRALTPEVVYLPHRGDNNQDHRAVFQAAQVVFRPAATPYLRRLLCYEVPSSTEQSPPVPEAAFLPNYYVDISGQIERKIQALACYGTELRSFPHPRSPGGLRVLAGYRGMASGFEAAEAFLVIRERVPAAEPMRSMAMVRDASRD